MKRILMNKEIHITGKKIFYRVYGSGKPVVLVHGFGETGDVWKNQVDFLKDKLQLIVPDLPGSGQSEMTDDMSIEGMADVLKTILTKETPKISPGGRFSKASMIGHSMGGYITLAFAEKYYNRLDSYGLFHSTAFADSEEKKDTRRKGIGFIREHGAYEFLKTVIPGFFAPNSKSKIPNSIEELVAKGNNFSSEVLVSYYESMIKRPDRTAVLKNIQLPVLFIMGEHDNAIPLEDGLKLCHLPEKAYFHILHQSGHMGMLEEADKTNRMLEEFLCRP